MLATFVIGLREGLEAALIVGIIAAFLRNNGKSLFAMWWGVGLAIALSIAVGVGLSLVEQALPQAAQEGMETVIGAVAIFFVTGMIAWMQAHARNLKKDLEAEAAEAISHAGAFALASMAFLAVLREGFETSVFLLATFSAAQSAAWAATGAIIGLVLAVLIGWGIYAGGVRINLSRFFRITGAFLILVAAGLVISSLRTAHEAGWLYAGQQATVNLAWLVAPGTVRSALITGVLGIPADPRLIEVIGWFAYLVPVSLFVYWPQSRRPAPRLSIRLKFGGAIVFALLALGLALFYPSARPDIPAQAALVAGADDAAKPVGSAQFEAGSGASPSKLIVSLDGKDQSSLPLPIADARAEHHDGVDVSAWSIDKTHKPSDVAASLTLDQVVDLAGGRIPVGFSPARDPGPFAADWSARSSTNIWVAKGVLIDAVARTKRVVTLSGGGLQTPRTLTVSDRDGPASGWRVSTDYRNQAMAGLREAASASASRLFWAIQLPALLFLIALLLATSGARMLIRHRRPRSDPASVSTTRYGQSASEPMTKGITNAVR